MDFYVTARSKCNRGQEASKLTASGLLMSLCSSAVSVSRASKLLLRPWSSLRHLHFDKHLTQFLYLKSMPRLVFEEELTVHHHLASRTKHK